MLNVNYIIDIHYINNKLNIIITRLELNIAIEQYNLLYTYLICSSNLDSN